MDQTPTATATTTATPTATAVGVSGSVEAQPVMKTTEGAQKADASIPAALRAVVVKDEEAEKKHGALTIENGVEVEMRCEKCGAVFAKRNSWKKHMARDTCWRTILKRQKMLNKADSLYTCNFPGCGKQYVNLSGLRRHRRSHDEGRNPKPQRKLLESFAKRLDPATIARSPPLPSSPAPSGLAASFVSTSALARGLGPGRAAPVTSFGLQLPRGSRKRRRQLVDVSDYDEEDEEEWHSGANSSGEEDVLFESDVEDERQQPFPPTLAAHFPTANAMRAVPAVPGAIGASGVVLGGRVSLRGPLYHRRRQQWQHRH
eukprot:GABV01000394.1.p1 GENE.GABV01000394.1~~GABV01000394.1.p1  ORF type:complete len:349 (+),score=101.67 GABV01000394.1:101-1048(+)